MAPGVASSCPLDGSRSRQAGPSPLCLNGECRFVKHFERSRQQERMLETTQEQSERKWPDRVRKNKRNLKGNKLCWTIMKRKGRVPVGWCPAIDWNGNTQVQVLGKNDSMYLLDSGSRKETWYQVLKYNTCSAVSADFREDKYSSTITALTLSLWLTSGFPGAAQAHHGWPRAQKKKKAEWNYCCIFQE